jgi:hypothetical protein
LSATKLKKLRIAASRQLRVPIVPAPMLGMVEERAHLSAETSASAIRATPPPFRSAMNRSSSRQVSR